MLWGVSCYIQRGGWTLLLGIEYKSRDYAWEKSTPAPRLLALLSCTTAQIIYIPNFDTEERTFGVLEITQIVFHNHLFLVSSMLSLPSYSLLFLLLFPLLFILAFLLLLLSLSLLLAFVCTLSCFLLCLPIVMLFLATALLLLRFLMFLSIFLSPPLILLIGDLGLWPAWLRADSRCYVLGCFTLGQRAT